MSDINEKIKIGDLERPALGVVCGGIAGEAEE